MVSTARDIDARPRGPVAYGTMTLGVPGIQTKRWSRREYDRLIEAGLLGEDEPIELVDGQMVVREPQHTPHATATQLVAEALRAVFGRGWHVRCGLPVALDDYSEPEPDVSVVRGVPRDYAAAHPSRPVLVVEVAKSSLDFDRRYKAAVYARARIPELWIVNLVDRVTEVYRTPARSPRSRYGWKYRSVRVLRPADAVAPLAARRTELRVADLLP